MKRLAIVTTHPIQYYAPLFRLLAQRANIVIKVFYTWGEQAKTQVYDPGFGATREWDIPLLDGYDYEFVENISKEPGSSHFNGIINPGLRHSIEKFGADALLMFGWAFKSHLKIMRYFKGKIPVLFRGDSTLIDESDSSFIKNMVRRIFLRWVYLHIDKAFYVGTNNKAYYKTHGIKENQLVYTPHAIDNNRFADVDGDFIKRAASWKSELKIPEDKIVVLFAGKLEPKKNPMFLVNAAQVLPNMHFIIAGNGILEKEIQQAANNISNLTLLPFQNQSVMPVLYRLANIYTLPSKGPGETWGLAINEAMACGRVIIASNKCGGAKDLILNNKNGVIIDPTIESFVAAVKSISENADMLKKGGSISTQHIANFTFEHIASAIEATVNN